MGRNEDRVPCGNDLHGGCKRTFRKTHGRQKYCELCRIDRNWYAKLKEDLKEEAYNELMLAMPPAPEPTPEPAPLVEVVIPQEPEPAPAAPVALATHPPRLNLPTGLPNVMVWVDFENLLVNLPSSLTIHEAIQKIQTLARTAGRLTSVKLFADWTNRVKASRSLGAVGVELVHVPAKTNGQDRSDMAIAMDLMDDGMRLADVAVLVSGDADFENSVRRLMRAGKSVAVLGYAAHTSNTLKTMADQYMSLDELFADSIEPEQDDRAEEAERATIAVLTDSPPEESTLPIEELYRLEAVVEEYLKWVHNNGTHRDVYLKAFRDRGVVGRMFADFRTPSSEDRHAIMRDLIAAGVFKVKDTTHWQSGSPIRAVLIDYDHPLVVESQRRVRAS